MNNTTDNTATNYQLTLTAKELEMLQGIAESFAIRNGSKVRAGEATETEVEWQETVNALLEKARSGWTEVAA
jgi:hypothetical protein